MRSNHMTNVSGKAERSEAGRGATSASESRGEREERARPGHHRTPI